MLRFTRGFSRRHQHNSEPTRAAAHQVFQDGDGEIEHAHLDRLSEGSVEAEQGLGFHAVGTAQPPLGLSRQTYTREKAEKVKIKMEQELPRLAAGPAVQR